MLMAIKAPELRSPLLQAIHVERYTPLRQRSITINRNEEVAQRKPGRTGRYNNVLIA